MRENRKFGMNEVLRHRFWGAALLLYNACTLLGECRALWQARSLLWVMTRREVAARHAGTAAGVLWPYLQPLLTVAAYYLVFDVVFSMRLGITRPRMP